MHTVTDALAEQLDISFDVKFGPMWDRDGEKHLPESTSQIIDTFDDLTDRVETNDRLAELLFEWPTPERPNAPTATTVRVTGARATLVRGIAALLGVDLEREPERK